MDNAEILVITESDDVHAHVIAAALEKRGVRVARLHTDRLMNGPHSWSITNGSEVNSWVPEMVRTVWYRRRTPVPQLGAELATVFGEFEANGLLDSIYQALADRRWVNPIPALVAARPKVAQLTKARSAGLLVPDTIVTNSNEALRDFFEQHNRDIVVKPLAAQVIHGNGESHVLGTRHVTDDRDLRSCVVLAPSLAQERLVIQAEVRAVVFGDEVHAFKMTARRTCEDIKQVPVAEIHHEPYQLDDKTAAGLRRLVRSYGLSFAAPDFLLTDRDELVFLELNPNGQWLWLEYASGYDLTSPFVDFLMR